MADAGAMRHAVGIIRGLPTPAVVVVSAMAGVTDTLLDLAARARAGERDAARSTIDILRARHAEVAQQLLPAGRVREELLAAIAVQIDELEAVAEGLTILGELTPRTRDFVAARGERLSARLFAAALQAAGRSARYVDAVELVATDGQFGGASPDLTLTDRLARRALTPLLARGIVPVVPGFIGAGPDGHVVTLGRGGSDLTATVLGRALGAANVSLWKDVPGLLTADPRVVPDARVIPQLNTREAAELAYYGAKVLHPRALIPLTGRTLPLFVRPFADPSARGTEISTRRTLLSYPVKALSGGPGQALVTVTGSGMLGVPGIAARTFGALNREGISVSLISQASSEHSICFSVPESSADTARQSLLQEFRDEIARREIDGVEVRMGVATIAIVGLGMAGTPGVATRVFSALSAADVNVVAIAQGSSELNISVVVDAAQAPLALRRIHAAFQLSKIGGGAVARPERADVVILGFGLIGRTLAELIGTLKTKPSRVQVVGIIDRSGFVFDAGGLSSRRLAALARAKQDGRALGAATGGHHGSADDAIAFVANHALTHPILVDLTADDTTATLRKAVSAGMNLVLANKRPLAGPRREADELAETVRAHGRRLLHETTVGAGLPIIDTYYKLVESGDRVTRIDGCLSGTIGYLLTEVGRGRRFSETVRRAMSKGYTEPDPRDDLSGRDVARKALILGRLLGYTGELETVVLESLVPDAARDLPLAQFLQRLEAFDEEWDRRVRAAQSKGGVLRYVATVTRRRISVGLETVEAASSFAALRGTDNQVVFTTLRYAANPLVITGPGAGPAVTAAGVLNDMLELA